MKSCVISICNNKGGVGKTTCTYNIAVNLARFGARVLMLDFDVQCDLTKLCGYKVMKRPGEEITDFGGRSVIDLMEKPDDILKSFFTIDDVEEYYRTHKQQKDLTESIILSPGSLRMAFMEGEFYSNPNLAINLKRSIETLKAYFQFILIDCPPTVGIVLQEALSVSDYAIIPVQPAFLDTEGTVLIDEAIKNAKKRNKDFDVLGTILNRYKMSVSIHQQYLAELAADKERELLGVIKDTALVTRAIEKGKGIPVSLDAPNSQPAEEFKKIATRIIEKAAKR